MAQNYYTILGVLQTATPEQIRSRFLELARSRHPDRFQGPEKAKAEAEFQAITEAFNILSNPERRRLHDLEVSRPEVGTRQADHAQVARVYLQRGVKAYREKDYREAAQNFDRATREDPGNGQAWHHLARALSHQPRFQARAAAAIQKACELEPMNATYLKLAGRLCIEAEMPTRALTYLEEARHWGADDPEIERWIEELKKPGKRWTALFGKGGS
jgi:curved DNA-binding protein CbpA